MIEEENLIKKNLVIQTVKVKNDAFNESECKERQVNDFIDEIVMCYKMSEEYFSECKRISIRLFQL